MSGTQQSHHLLLCMAMDFFCYPSQPSPPYYPLLAYFCVGAILRKDQVGAPSGPFRWIVCTFRSGFPFVYLHLRFVGGCLRKSPLCSSSAVDLHCSSLALSELIVRTPFIQLSLWRSSTNVEVAMAAAHLCIIRDGPFSIKRKFHCRTTLPPLCPLYCPLYPFISLSLLSLS